MSKFAKTMQAQDKEDEQKHGGSNDEWVEEMSDVYESEVAPSRDPRNVRSSGQFGEEQGNVHSCRRFGE